MGCWGLSLAVVWAGEGEGQGRGQPRRPRPPGARGVLCATRAGGREPPRSDEAIAGNVRLGPSGAAAGKGEGTVPAGPARSSYALSPRPTLPATCAGLRGGRRRLLARPSTGGRCGKACPDPPCLQGALALYTPGVGVLFFAGPSTPRVQC